MQAHHQQQQQRRAAVVRHRGQQRPAEHDVRQAGRQLHGQHGQQHGRHARDAGHAARAQAQPRQVAQDDRREHAVRPVDGDQRIVRDEITASGTAELTPEREAVREVHRRHPLAVAQREVGTGQHRVVGADPAAQRDLRHQQRQADRRRHAQRRAPAVHQARRIVLAAEPDQRRQQRHAQQQVRHHDRRLQLERDGPGAERALQAHQPQHRSGVPRRLPELPAPGPRQHHQRDDQHAQRQREIAVRHLDPRLHPRHRARWHGRLRGMDVVPRVEGVGGAVAAGPVGAAQAGVGQAREAAEHDEVQRQERRDPHQLAVFVAVALDRHVAQRNQRDQDADRCELQQHGLSDARILEQPAEVAADLLRVRVLRELHHQVAERIDQVDVVGRGVLPSPSQPLGRSAARRKRTAA